MIKATLNPWLFLYMALPEDILKQYWNFDSFRHPQREIIQSVLDGHDTLALLPTGAGKSVCFQVPALCQNGLTIVVSPLIALMRDQVMNLNKKGIKAMAVVSGMRHRDIDIALDNCIYGDIKFLYLSPERLKTELFRERVKRMKINLIAVDEAHCISQWGYDFRPAYIDIAELRHVIPHVPILAVTASATKKVAEDIVQKLSFSKSYQFFKTSFERKNIQYLVVHTEDKEGQILDILQHYSGSGIIYINHRKKVEKTAAFLLKHKIQADFYHAGLDMKVRTQKQDAWIRGNTRVIVATSAFGMGIDKPDVRWVIHLDLPESLESYYQESGRAGRDGQNSVAILLCNENDCDIQEKQFKEHFPEKEEIRAIYQSICNYLQLAIGSGENQDYPFDIIDFCYQYSYSIRKVLHALSFLEQLQLITFVNDIHIPSKARIIFSSDELYQFRLKYPDLDEFLMILLRNYPGIMDDLVVINESYLAQWVNKKTSDITALLVQLKQSYVIQYFPKTDEPILFFNSERISEKNISLNTTLYDQRKLDTLRRLESVWNYAYSDQCRVKTMLYYFQEKKDSCTACDVCLEQTFDSKKSQELEHQILKNTVHPQSLEDILKQLPYTYQNQAVELIRSLLEEKKLNLTPKGDYMSSC